MALVDKLYLVDSQLKVLDQNYSDDYSDENVNVIKR
jgi:hypothetical protein